MPVTRAKQVSPTPLDGALLLSGKRAVKRDRCWSSVSQVAAGWLPPAAYNAGSQSTVDQRSDGFRRHAWRHTDRAAQDLPSATAAIAAHFSFDVGGRD
jgi:hypothetical protein